MAARVETVTVPENATVTADFAIYLGGQFDLWQQAAAVMAETASAIMVRQAEMMRIASRNAAGGMMMFGRDSAADDPAASYATDLRHNAEAMLDDMREIGMLSRDCANRLYQLYAERWRALAMPHG